MAQENPEITIDQVRAFISANMERPDVAEYLSEIAVEKPLTSETVTAYLGTIEGKNLIQPQIDRSNTQAIKTHDEKQRPIVEATIKARVNEELLRMNPQETPEQRQIREMRQEQESMKSQWERERLQNNITTEFAKRNVPLELAKDIPYTSIDHAINIALIWDQMKQKEVDKLVNERLASGFKPGSGMQEEHTGDPTKNMNDKEKFDYYARQAMARETGKVQ